MPQRMPPTRTTSRGPKRSTRYPSTGTSQVSSKTNTENATWIEARPQWNLASIGFTNSVQPYCRFAIIAMQTMPTASCTHRYAAGFVPSPSWTIAPISSPLPPGHRGLDRTVHAQHQLVGMPVQADRARHRLESSQGRRQRNLDAVVAEKPVLDAQARDGGLSTPGKRFLQSVDGVAIGDVFQARSRYRGLF